MPGKIQRIVLLGAGNVGSHLAEAIVSKGFELEQVYSRTIQRAKELAIRYHAAYTNEVDSLAQEADLYIFCVKDDAVAELASKLSLQGRFVVHTSGALPADALTRVSDHHGVFYPLQTFTAGLEISWNEIPICIEASAPEMLEQVKTFGSSISGKVLETSYEDRRKLHVAAVFVNNFTNYLLQNAEAIMKQTSLPFSVLEPLAKETIRKAFLTGPSKSQTGPAARGDDLTITAHEELLAAYPDIREVYRVLTEKIRQKG